MEGKRDAAIRRSPRWSARCAPRPRFLGGSDFTIADIANYAYAHLGTGCGFPLAS